MRRRPEPRFLPPPPVISGKPPPQDLDSEAACLSAGMLSAEALDVVLLLLRRQHFYSSANGLIFAVMEELVSRTVPVDVVTIANVLRDRGQLATVGGPSYLGQLADASPATVNVEAHCKIVRDKADLRDLISQCQRSAALGYGEVGEVREFIDEQQTAIAEVGSDMREDALVTSDEAIGTWFKRFATEAKGVAMLGLPTGFADIDRLVTFLPGDVTIIAARPGMGKTSLAMGIIANIVNTDPERLGEAEPLGAAIFSLEMPIDQLLSRASAARSGVDVQRVLRGTMFPNEWSLLTDAAQWYADLQIAIDDTPAITLLDLRGKIRLAKRKLKAKGRRLRVAMIDYLQLMKSASTRVDQSREQDLSEISAGLKQIAKEEQMHVIALSQLNRSCEARRPPRPQLSDLRESGAIEQDADNVLMVYRAEYYADRMAIEEIEKGTAEVIVSKQRNGASGVATRLRFYASCTRFDNLAQNDAGPD